ncbi:putative E3 ubiquitin-protein ligase MARCH [Helianthus annuus]|nr:putative E3 ubiquitin-protein ligase MARCH [Helianthus annuus]
MIWAICLLMVELFCLCGMLWWSRGNPKSIDAATTIIRFLINLQRRHFISALDSQLCFIDPSFAHRKCFQKCCNKKGDITCEICNQIYSPDYALPPARTNPDLMTIDIR